MILSQQDVKKKIECMERLDWPATSGVMQHIVIRKIESAKKFINGNIAVQKGIKVFGNVQTCMHDVGWDGEAHFLKTLSKPLVADDPICIGLRKTQQIAKGTLV